MGKKHLKMDHVKYSSCYYISFES